MKAVLRNNSLDPKSVILIVDRIGVFGEKLSFELSKDYFVILVSNRLIENRHKNITQIRYSKKVPKIPRNNYSKIYVIDDGREVTKDVFKSIVKETKDFDSEIYLLTSLRNPYSRNADRIIKNNKKAKLLIFGDVFDNDFYFEKDSSITQFLKSIRKRKKIVAKNDGLGVSYPIALEDTLKLIIKASFIKVPQKIILLFYTSSITDMSLAHMFQKIDPEIDLDFKDTDEESKVYFPKEATHAIKNYDVLKRLRTLSLNKEIAGDATPEKQKSRSLEAFKYLFFFIALMGFIFLLPLLTTHSYIKIGFYQIEKSHEEAKKGNYAKATEKAKSANELFVFAKESNEILEKQLELFNATHVNDGVEENIISGSLLSGAMMNFYKGMVFFDEIGVKDGDGSSESFDDGIKSLKTSYSLFQKINFVEELGTALGENILGAYPFIEKVVNVSEVLPEIFGIDGEKKYLILFQDNTDARPSGGTVSVVGLASFEDLKLKDLDIVSIDELSENNNNLSSSFIGKRFLDEDRPTIKNSGLNLDSTTNAVAASTLYGLGNGAEVDGVIIVNGEVVVTLLERFGPLTIDSGEGISEENFYDELALSDDKAKYYKSVVLALVEEISESSDSIYYSLFQILGDSIVSKDIVFALRDPELQSVFLSNKLSGSIVDIEQDDDALNDFFGLFETSIGEESVSRFISRSVSKINNITVDGSISSELSVSFKNNSPTSVLGPRSYESYVQLLLPLGTIIDEVSVGGQRKNIIPAITDEAVYERDDFFQTEDFELRQGVEGGKGVFGFYVEVPPDATKIVKIDYSLPFSISAADRPTNYNLKIFKQPGVEPYPFNLLFNSRFFQVLPEDSVSTEIDQDKELNFLISKK